MGIFESKNIKPMLIAEMKEPFNSPDYTFEIKWDGIRCVAYLDGNETDIRNKRNKIMAPIIPELRQLHKQVKSKCILDGELVVLKNGSPDFYEIQRRALMNDPFKIELSYHRYPASFIAYDILYHEDKEITDIPLIDRKEILDKLVIENNLIAVSRYIENNGIQLFDFVRERNLEGIVAKKKSSLYWQGKRSKDWIKCKIMSTIDCVVCGYIVKDKSMSSLILGLYDGDRIVYKGHVTLGVSLKVLMQHGFNRTDISPFAYIPKGNEEAVWIEPDLVCIVESMPTEKDSFRQPVFKGFRDDKDPRECVIGQL